MTKKASITAILGLTVLLCVPSFATVSTTLTVSDGLGNSLTVMGNGTITCVGTCSPGGVLNTGDHNTFIVAAATVGQFKIDSLTAQGWGSVVAPGLENTLNTDTSSLASGTLTITYSDYGFSGLTNGIMLAGSGSTTTIPNSTVDFSAYGSASNAVPATTLIGALPQLTGSSFNNTSTFANPIGSSGSLTESIVIAFNGKGSEDTTFGLSNIPEPAGIFLMGTVLLGLVRVIRRKRTQ